MGGVFRKYSITALCTLFSCLTLDGQSFTYTATSALNERLTPRQKALAQATVLLKNGDQHATGIFINARHILTSYLATQDMPCPGTKVWSMIDHKSTFNIAGDIDVKGMNTICAREVYKNEGSDVRILAIDRPYRYFVGMRAGVTLANGETFDIAGYITRGYMGYAEGCTVVERSGPSIPYEIDVRGKSRRFNLADASLSDCITDQEMLGAPMIQWVDEKPEIIGLFHKEVALSLKAKNDWIVVAPNTSQKFLKSYLSGHPLEDFIGSNRKAAVSVALPADIPGAK